MDRAAAFKQALAAGQRALKARLLAEAREAAATTRAEARALDGEARFQAGQLALRVEAAAQDGAAAAAVARALRLECGPEKLEACRAAAVAGLATAARWPGAGADAAGLARAFAEADECAAKAERASAMPACAAKAQRTASGEQDALLEQRLALAQALHERREDRQAELLEKAEALCATAPCAGLRRKALGRLMALARARGEHELVVRLALRDQEVAAAGLPEGERFYARTRELDAACLAFDAAAGTGACRALEKKLTGRWTFRDFSRAPSNLNLLPSSVREVNEHFAPLLQECLSEQARRMTPPDAQRFEVRWVVVNDGRVAEPHLRRDLDDTPFARCVKAQFAGWRYPPFEGEYQNVEQSFTVTATARRLR